MKTGRLFLYIFIFLIVCSTAKSEVINYLVMSLQGRPFQIEDNGKNHEGIITDLIFEILKNSGHTLKIHTLPYKRVRMYMQTREFPNWIAYGSPAWGPQNDNLSDTSVLGIKNILLVSKKSNFTFNRIEDLFGKSIILLFAFQYKELDPYIKTGKIKELRVKNFDMAYKAVDINRGVGVPDMLIRMKYNIIWQGRKIQKYNIYDFSTVLKNYDIYLNMDPEISPSLQEFINKRLTKLKSEGFIDKTVYKYTNE